MGLMQERRISCPLHCSDAEIAVWNQVVGDQPASSFTETHSPLLEMYCRHVVQSRVIADELLNFDRAWLSDDDGLKRYNILLGMAERESRSASSLATRLRLTRQSIDHNTAGNALKNHIKTKKPWELVEAD